MSTPDPARILRALKRELHLSLRLLERTTTAVGQGQREALRHVLTVIRNREAGRPRRPARR